MYALGVKKILRRLARHEFGSFRCSGLILRNQKKWKTLFLTFTTRLMVSPKIKSLSLSKIVISSYKFGNNSANNDILDFRLLDNFVRI